LVRGKEAGHELDAVGGLQGHHVTLTEAVDRKEASEFVDQGCQLGVANLRSLRSGDEGGGRRLGLDRPPQETVEAPEP
jgi:hypothetical protein